MKFEIKIFNQYNLQINKKYSVCPICSAKRKKSKQKCMLLDWKRGLGTCMHCGKTIQLHLYQNYDKIYKDYRNPITKHKSIIPEIDKPSFISNDIFTKTLGNNHYNIFINYLIKQFGYYRAFQLKKKYYIGTSKYWNGATVFWQVDNNLKIRSGKIMLYNSLGKRIRKPYNHINWVHKVLNLPNYNLQQCFFGEHLLKEHKPIAIVESEKTAIIASVYLPRFSWLAVGSINNLNVERCKVLVGRDVVLYPDINAYELWEDKSNNIAKHLNVRFSISDLLEENANCNERKQGLDLADYLLKYSLNDFNQISNKITRLDKLIKINPHFVNLIESFNLDI